MRMCCCWPSHHSLCWRSSSCGGLENYWQSSELHDCEGASNATATWWQAHFGAVMSGSLQLSLRSSEKLKVENSSREKDPVEVWKYQLDGVKVLFAPHRRSQSHFPNYKYKGKCWFQGHCMKVHVLMRTSAWSPVASSSGTHSNLWRATPWLFKGTSLLMQYEHSCHRDTSQNSGWSGNPYQPNTPSGPLDQDCWRDCYK